MKEKREVALPKLASFLLLAAIFIAAGCAIVYELLIGSTSSYFLGDSVEQFSLTIGFFLFAMGVGSWLSRLIQEDLLARFIALEVWLGLIGGSSVPALYIFYAYTDSYRYCMLVLILLIGTLIGLEVPLLTRVLRSYGSLRTILSDVLSLDYLGSLVAALLFPFVFMPVLGAMHTSLLSGLVNVAVAIAMLWVFRAVLPRRARRLLSIQSFLISLFLIGLLLKSQPLLERWENALYSDRIVLSEQSAYQKIVLTKWRESLRLFLNGHLQFASVDEHRYHEALVHPAMELATSHQRVLIIGGGDGLTAREVLKYPDVEHIDLVDLDPVMTNLARRNIYLTQLNDNALSARKVSIANEDGFIFLQQEHLPYGVILVDLPDPREESLAKLYSVEAYKLCRRHLSPGGVLATQATSPYFARRSYWSIGATLEEAGFNIWSYHVQVPSFGEWGFHLASEQTLDLENVVFKAPRRFLQEDLFGAMFLFDPDMDRVAVEANRLDKPVLARYYREEWSRW